MTISRGIYFVSCDPLSIRSQFLCHFWFQIRFYSQVCSNFLILCQSELFSSKWTVQIGSRQALLFVKVNRLDQLLCHRRQAVFELNALEHGRYFLILTSIWTDIHRPLDGLTTFKSLASKFVPPCLMTIIIWRSYL